MKNLRFQQTRGLPPEYGSYIFIKSNGDIFPGIYDHRSGDLRESIQGLTSNLNLDDVWGYYDVISG